MNDYFTHLMIKYLREFKYRNGQSGNQLNKLASTENDYLIPHELVVELPKPRYERNIVERDALGRILHSKPPLLNL